MSDPNLPSAPSLSLGHGDLFFRMMLSVGLVIGLGALALYLSKRALPRAGGSQRGIWHWGALGHSGAKEIHVLETAYLGPRKALHLVEVGGQRLLIASTSDRVTMLASLHEAWAEAPEETRLSSRGGAAGDVLRPTADVARGVTAPRATIFPGEVAQA